MEVTEREKWVIDELKKGSAVYVENEDLIRSFRVVFLPELHFSRDYEQIVKELQKCLRSLRKKDMIKKRAMGVYGAKTSFLLGRNWIWCWMLNDTPTP